MTTTTTTTDPQIEAIFGAVEKAYGWVPNLIKEMSASVPTIQVYLGGQEALAKGSLSPKEQQAVQLTISAFNDCEYCQAVHGTFGRKVRVAEGDIEAIRAGQLPADPALAPVVETTRLLLDKRGWLSPEELQAAEDRGITKTRLHEIIAYIGLKTITNYINHLAHTPVDSQFQA